MRFSRFGFALLAAMAAYGDQFNQKALLIGDKGAALGGAFTGLADDATATFYNPAGLTQVKNVKLNVSAQVVQFQKQGIQIAPDVNLPYNSFNFSPSIASFSQRLGRWAYGFSIVTPQNDLFRGEQEMQAGYHDTSASSACYGTAGETPCTTRLSLAYSDVSKINLVGPSLAYKWNDRLSLGVTVYGIYSTQIERTSYGGWDANFVGANNTDPSKFYEDLVWRTVSQTGYGVTGAFGVFYRTDATFSLGVRVSPGSVVKVDRIEEQRVEVFVNERVASSGQTDTITTFSSLYALDEQLGHNEITAPGISAGVAWSPIPSLAVAGQVDYLLGSLYDYTGFSPKGNDSARSGFDLTRPERRSFQMEKIAAVNFSGGVDWRLNPVYSLTWGGFTDFSQGPFDSRGAAWNKRVDYFGTALSLGMVKQFTESRFGITGAWGRAAISHFQWEQAAGGKPVIVLQGDGSVYRPRKEFDAMVLGIFMSSTLKI